MELRTARLLLRPWRRDDVAAIAHGANHREVWLNTGSMPFPYTETDAHAYLDAVTASPDDLHFAIVASGEPVGAIGVSRRKAPLQRFTGEIGYWLAPSAWGRGYASEAARAVADHALAGRDLARLEGLVFTRNPASCRVLEKAGFRREALLRRAAWKGGELLDELLYARLRGE
jgi:RimJ/RimL family protein N-acetyltransferase